MADGQPEHGPITQYVNAKDYLDRNCIPQMFKGLISGLMVQRPPDHYEYMDVKLDHIKDVGVKNVNWESFVYELHPKRDPVHMQYVHDEHYEKEMRRRKQAGIASPAPVQTKQKPVEVAVEKEETDEESALEDNYELDEQNSNKPEKDKLIDTSENTSSNNNTKKISKQVQFDAEIVLNTTEDEVKPAESASQAQEDSYKPDVFQLTETQDEPENETGDDEYSGEADDEGDGV